MNSPGKLDKKLSGGNSLFILIQYFLNRIMSDYLVNDFENIT